MTAPESPTVVGLLPRAVRMELTPDQGQLLVNELLTGIEIRSGSLRENHDRTRALSPAVLEETSERLLEYRMLLDELGEQLPTGRHLPTGRRLDGATVFATAAMTTADALVRSCTQRATEAFVGMLDHRRDLHAVRSAGAAVSAWATTLADLRGLEEDAPEVIYG